MSRPFSVDKIGASYIIPQIQTVGNIWPGKKLKGINNMEEYNLLTVNKIGGGFSARYTVTVL